jgi:hypothetical protein
LEGSVAGEMVSVIGFDYDGNTRRGLTVKCRRADGSMHVIGAADVTTALNTEAAQYLAAYRKWMGLVPFPRATPVKARTKATVAPISLDDPVELVVVSLKQKAARCRVLKTGESITLRAGRLWAVCPGEIAVVRPKKQWSYGGHPYLSGSIESARLDAAALGLTPLALRDRRVWDPKEHCWGDPGRPLDDWERAIIAWGPRDGFEMEQVLPGQDPEDPFDDPIIEANDHKEAGDCKGAYEILMGLCQADLRCLDAHAHLGNIQFDTRPQDAIRHYEVGFRIGELSLAAEFEGLLPWGRIDNRPFLRCMIGYGLCLWRLGKFEEAERIFKRMLWLNPSDNQGVRFLIEDVRGGIPWKERAD